MAWRTGSLKPGFCNPEFSETHWEKKNASPEAGVRGAVGRLSAGC